MSTLKGARGEAGSVDATLGPRPMSGQRRRTRGAARFRPLFGVALAVVVVVSCGGDVDEAKTPAPAPMSIAFPSTVMRPGAENTECVVLRLPNEGPLHVGQIHNALGKGSHHLIVYRVYDEEEKPTPFPCTPFTDTLDPTKGSPLMVTQKADDTLRLPDGVAFSLEPHQMIRLEMHYINPSATERAIQATTTFVPISDDDFRDEADFLFVGTPDIQLAPKSTATLGPTFFQLPDELASVKFFAMTGHQHHYGTNVQVAHAAGPTDPGTMLYDVPDWRWDEPKTEVFSPPVTLAPGNGFNFTCQWNNTSDRNVYFGESAEDEMCFFWAYYYPSRGARVCFHTTQVGGQGGFDMCCPGHGLCGALNEELKRRGRP